MTAEGELFVTEAVRDLVVYELRKAGLLGEDEWVEVECPNEWRDKWSASEYPEGGEARIYEETEDGKEKYVGEVEWKTDFYVEEDFGGRYVDAEPVITRLEYKGKVVIESAPTVAQNIVKPTEMNEKAIVITRRTIAEFLEGQLGRKPSEKEVDEFMDYIEVDIYEWLRDNFKAWTIY